MLSECCLNAVPSLPYRRHLNSIFSIIDEILHDTDPDLYKVCACACALNVPGMLTECSLNVP
jgi:hypothetical protein